MRFNLNKIEKVLLDVIKREYLVSSEEYFLRVDSIRYEFDSGYVELKGAYGREGDENKSFQKEFTLLLRNNDLTKYAYLQGVFSQYIYDKEQEC